VIARRSHDAESCSDASSSLDSSAALITVDARGFASGAPSHLELWRETLVALSLTAPPFSKKMKNSTSSRPRRTWRATT
jgi:hypothetical protein